jgi:hypothetical protein
MPYSAAQLIAQAAQDAKAPNYTAQGLVKLNLVLEELCVKHSFSAARGVFYFLLNPSKITTLNGVTNFGGPYLLPLDYLRTSESSGSEGTQYSFYYVYNGVPYPLMPWDLAHGDMQVQQPGIQNLPYAYYTDMATESTAADRIVGSGVAATTINVTTITLPAAIPSLQVGHGMSGIGIAPGAVVTAIDVPGTGVTLSLPCTATVAAASFMFGIPPTAWVYPGPSGAFPTTLRYQRLMPPLTNTALVPWFPDQAYLLERLTAELMVTTDDERRQTMLAVAAARLGKYEIFADDKTNRAQRVQLDRNAFGPRFQRLRNTKTIGW